MKSRTTRSLRFVLVGLTVAMAGAALAWACHPAASISLSPSICEPGTQVTVTGRQFPANDVVRISWEGSGGTELARATTAPDGTLSTSITIPDAPADVYTVAATGSATNSGGTLSSFTIPGARPAPGDGSRSPAPAPVREQGAPHVTHTTSGATSGSDATATRGSAARERAVTRGGSRTSAPPSPGQGPADERVATLPSGNSVFADSLDRPADATKAGARTKGAHRPARAISQASAAGDLWSGFSSRRAPGVLLDGGAVAERSEAPASIPLISMALLGLGLMTVVAGAGVAGLRRRRVLARSGNGSSSV